MVARTAAAMAGSEHLARAAVPGRLASTTAIIGTRNRDVMSPSFQGRRTLLSLQRTVNEKKRHRQSRAAARPRDEEKEEYASSRGHDGGEFSSGTPRSETHRRLCCC